MLDTIPTRYAPPIAAARAVLYPNREGYLIEYGYEDDDIEITKIYIKSPQIDGLMIIIQEIDHFATITDNVNDYIWSIHDPDDPDGPLKGAAKLTDIANMHDLIHNWGDSEFVREAQRREMQRYMNQDSADETSD